MSTSRSRESSLWEWLSRAAPTGSMLKRVEDILDRGTPDVFMIYDGQVAVVELKSVQRAPTIYTELRAEQASVLRRWWRAGGRAYVLVQVGVARDAKRYLVAAERCDDLLQRVPESRLAELSDLDPSPSADKVIKHVCRSQK